MQTETSLLLSFGLNVFYFYCVIALVRTYMSVLKRGGKSGHCLVPGLGGKIFIFFLPVSMMLAVSLSCIPFIMLRSVPALLRFEFLFLIMGVC